MAQLTGDYEGDGLNLGAHITGDPVGTLSGNVPLPSARVVALIIYGAIGLLVLMAFGLNPVRL